MHHDKALHKYSDLMALYKLVFNLTLTLLYFTLTADRFNDLQCKALNSVLVGLPWSITAPLQRVQNAAARLVMGLSARDHVGPALRELHWLPLAHRNKFKVALLMYLAHNRLSPLYISEMLAPVSSTLMHRQLRSSGSSNYTVPKTKSKLGDRAFSVAGPVIWNSIPESVRLVDNVHTFKRLLKTHFF